MKKEKKWNRKTLLLLTATLVSGLTFGGCSVSTNDTTSDNPAEETTEAVEVTIIDGRVDGAKVFADCNRNRVFDKGEPSTISINGTAKLNIPSSCDYNEIIAIMDNATDIDLGIKVNGALIAPKDSEVVSPLTTLVAVKPEIKEVLKNLGIEEEPEKLNYGEAWNTLDETAKAFIANLVVATNTISKEVGDENLKVKVVEEVAENIASKLETLNTTVSTDTTNATQLLADIVTEAITSVDLVESANETELKETILSFSENVTETDDFADLKETLNETISTLENAVETINATTESISDEQAITYLVEGRFDLLRTLLEGKTDTDAKKVAYALSVLGTSVDNNFLSKLGSYIIPGSNSLFDISESTKDVNDVSLPEWKESVNSLVSDLNTAVKELESVSDTLRFTIPSDIADNQTLVFDKATLDTLKGLLLSKKAFLEYLLAYDWSVYENSTEEGILPYLEKLTLVDSSLISSAKSDAQKALGYLKAVGDDVNNADNFTQSILYNALGDDKDEDTVKADIENTASITISDLMDSLYGSTVIESPDKESNATVDLSYLFSNPLDGSKIRQDVENGLVKEFSVCSEVWQGGYYVYNSTTGTDEWVEYTTCEDNEREIWFKKDSYLYTYYQSLSPSIKMYERSYDNETWYTLSDNEYWSYDYAPVYPYPPLIGIYPTESSVSTFLDSEIGSSFYMIYWDNSIIPNATLNKEEDRYYLNDEYNSTFFEFLTDEVIFLSDNTIVLSYNPAMGGWGPVFALSFASLDEINENIDGNWKIYFYDSTIKAWKDSNVCVNVDTTQNKMTRYVNGIEDSSSNYTINTDSGWNLIHLESAEVDLLPVEFVNNNELVMMRFEEYSHLPVIWLKVDKCTQ
ncbi:MAG: hypothetical protein ABGX27_02565 [Desulfurobacteriaceae bacterium]